MGIADTKAPIVVGITGASGAVLARAMVDRLLGLRVPVIMMASSAARMVWRQEIDESYGETLERWSSSGNFTHYAIGDLAAPIASGTFPTSGMVVIPCSMGSAAAIANGMSDNLIRRAADVTLKESRRLVIVPRETPMNAINLENLSRLAQVGATVLLPHPAFYLRPTTLTDVVEFVIERALLSLGLLEALPEHLRYVEPSE